MNKQHTIISPFLKHEDGDNISSYIESGGFQGLKSALMLSPSKIIDLITESGLRGRGGAGFPTGVKWKYASQPRSEIKYVICNADEGEPGTFKDKLIMEKAPYLFIEGMVIAAYAIGASKGYIYIRGEYSKSISAIQKAISEMYNHGLLGESIAGNSFVFDLEIMLGAGSYLCGEELTLIESLEGKRGYPRIKPPFPAEKGLFLKPTLVNNVETLANVPFIIQSGPDAYRKFGTEKSAGTKLFCISGDVEKPGCFEASLGISLRELIYDFAGGIKNNGTPGAFLTGGAAGTFIPPSLIDIRMDYDTLQMNNATLGSGAIIVLDNTKSIYNFLGSILRFFKHESCGKCVPCRIGCYNLLKIWEQCKDHPECYPDLEKEAAYIAKTSLCPLGQSPILSIKSALHHFKHSI